MKAAVATSSLRHSIPISTCYKRSTIKRLAVMPPNQLIDPDFINTYIASVCGASPDPAYVRACVDSFMLPPLEQQGQIMQVLRDLHEIIDIGRIQGPIMNLLIKGEEEKVQELLDAYTIYLEALQTMRNLCEEALEVTMRNLESA